MAYTMRNLVDDAYRKSGVVGVGMTMRAEQLTHGISNLNFILDKAYSKGAGTATISVPVTFNGSADYTVGQAQDLGDPQPDIELPLMPHKIEKMILYIGGAGGSRIICMPIDPETYHSRVLQTINNQAPYGFFFERTFPLGAIRFYEGEPTGEGELIYTPSGTDVTANTDYKTFSRELKPYLVNALAAVVARENGFDDMSLKADANNDWNNYRASKYQGQRAKKDRSAPGFKGRNDSKYDIYRGY